MGKHCGKRICLGTETCATVKRLNDRIIELEAINTQNNAALIIAENQIVRATMELKKFRFNGEVSQN